MKILKHVVFALVFLAAVMTGRAFSTELQKTFERNFEFTPGGNFILENYRGDVKIHSGDFKSVEVKAVIKVNYYEEAVAAEVLKKTEVIVKESTTNSLILDVNTDKDFINELNQRISNQILNVGSYVPILVIHFDVNVPHEINLTLKTYKGIITAGDIQGKIKAKSFKGDVTITNIKGGVIAETYKAPLELTGIDGAVQAKNYKGDIHIKQIDGSVFAENYKDRINYELAKLANQKNIEFKNYKGAIIVLFPENLNADVSIKNYKGEINSEFPIKMTGKLSKNGMYGSINNGGIPLSINNYKGSVLIKKM